MNYSGQIYPKDTVGYFRIASSNGREPIQPVVAGQFLIGSGVQCQLRLGDDEIPEIHTVLEVVEDTVTLSTKTDSPCLLINGTAPSSAKLEDGDLLEIGSYRMLFRRASADARITLDEERFNSEADITTAEQLVDRLDEQIRIVEELSDTPEDGLSDLMDAVAQADQSSSARTADLGEVKQLIERHHEASRIRLESLTEVLDSVVKQQKLIADTLEVLSERVQKFDAGSGGSYRKAS